MNPILRSVPVLVVLASPAFGATYANFVVGNYVPSATPGYFALAKSESVPMGASGSFTASVSTTGISWGTTIGPNPPTGVAINSSWIDPAFPGDLTGATALAIYGAANQTVTFTFDFSSLSNGYLPAGSVIAYNDVDGTEKALFSSATANWYSLAPSAFFQGGVNVGSPWGSGQPSPAPGDAPLTAGSTANILSLTGPGTLTDGVTNFIVTQQDISNLTVTASGSLNTQFVQGIAIATIPETSTSILAALGIGGLMLRRRR